MYQTERMKTPTRPHLPSNYASLAKKYRKVDAMVLKSASTESSDRAALSTGLALYQGAWEEAERLHFLKRTLFGVRKSDLSAFQGMSLNDAVAAILTKGQVPDVPINDYDDPSEGVEDPDVAFGQTWINAPRGGDYEGERVLSLKSWLINNKVTQQATLEEKMLLFWHNLIPTKAWDLFYAKLTYRYFEKIRTHVFGNYKTLIKDLTLDPAMLLFLNGALNNKDAPDENFGRELQELFCIGKGTNAKYTEDDVKNAARVLTGWSLDWNTFDAEGETTVVFNTWGHDTADKQFSSFYGNKLIAGKDGDAGQEELDELLDMIFDNDETALYLSRRLYNFFVYHSIDAATEQNVIVPMAKLIRDNDYEMKPVLTALLSSEHFYDVANRGALIKSPLDFQIGLWRTLEMVGVDPSDSLRLNKQHQSLLWTMANQGMEVADPPNVAGWPAHYQAPSYDKYWITTDTIANRALTTDSLLFWGFWIADGSQIPVDLIAFLEMLDDPSDPNQMLEEASRLIHGIALGSGSLTTLKGLLLSGQQTDSYWTSAWNQLMEEPNNAEYRMVVESRLKTTFQQLLQFGEAQLY